MKIGFCCLILFLITNGCSEKATINQEGIWSKPEIDSIISLFETIHFSKIETDYLHYTSSNHSSYRPLLRDKTFLIVRGKDIFNPIVGQHTIQNFLCTDGYYNRNMDNLDSNKKQYWLVNKNLLYAILDISLSLKEMGYDPNGFSIRESHRHPKYNALKGGAKKSQHIIGNAADLVTEDINMDGIISNTDKEILCSVSERIIGRNGGMGLYPSTMTVHIDVKGFKARW